MLKDAETRVRWRDLAAEGHLPRLLLYCFGIWLHGADSSLMATLIPAAVGEVGGVALVNWTLSLYELGTILAGTLTALLLRRLQIARAEALAALLYALGCLTSALAPSMETIVAGRLIQGLGGGGLIALAFVACRTLFPRPHWPRAMAVISGFWGTSALLGPLVGGLFADAGLWRGAFLAFAGQALLLAFLALALLGKGAAVENDAPPPGRPPFLRLLMLTIAVLALATAGLQTALLAAGGYLGFGVILLYWLFRRDARSRTPLFPRQLLQLSTTAGQGLLAIFLLPLASISFATYGPLIMNRLHGADALTAGYLIALESFGWTLAALAVSGLSARREATAIRAGTLCVAIGLLGFAIVMPLGNLWLLVPCALGQGAGFGMSYAFLTRRIIEAVPSDEETRAAAALPPLQRLGYALGAALAGIVAGASGIAVDEAGMASAAFWVFAAFLPLAFLGVAAAWSFTRKGAPPDFG